MPCFFNFPVSRARPEKLCGFLLAATSKHVQVRLDCSSRKNILRQQRTEKVSSLCRGGRYKTQVTGHRSGHRSQVTGHRAQVTGYRAQGTGYATIRHMLAIDHAFRFCTESKTSKWLKYTLYWNLRSSFSGDLETRLFLRSTRADLERGSERRMERKIASSVQKATWRKTRVSR